MLQAMIGLDNESKLGYKACHRSEQPFVQIIQRLAVSPNAGILSCLLKNQTNDILSINFHRGQIDENDAAILKDLMKNVEVLELYSTMIPFNCRDVHHCLLQYCSSIRQLNFDRLYQRPLRYEWLMNSYPTMEYLRWRDDATPNLMDFLLKNPKVRGIYADLEIVDQLYSRLVYIDELHLGFERKRTLNERLNMNNYLPKLNTLYERQQFRSLMVNFEGNYDRNDFYYLLNGSWDRMEYLHGAMVADISKDSLFTALSSFVHLKLLAFKRSVKLTREKATILSKHLINLEEIHTKVGSFDSIVPFIKNCSKLKRICKHSIETAEIQKDFLFSLNQDRNKLTNACKTTIYLFDDAYVKLKWATNCINYNLIDVKRLESNTSIHPFVAFNLPDM